MRVPARVRFSDDWTLLFDPYYRNRRLWLRLIPQRIANRLGLWRQYGRVRCALGVYPKHPAGWCWWCGKEHGRRWS